MWLNKTFSRKNIGLILGPVFFFLVLTEMIPFGGLTNESRAVLATVFWIAAWWMTEAMPLAATSLLPIVLLPLTGGAPVAQTTAAYGDKMLFLFMGGFILAVAMQKWNLHKRIALSIIAALGVRADLLILGFIIATGFLSMWISNTATALMMATIGLALIRQTSEYMQDSGKDFYKALLLAIASSASIGGIATLVGTPTNPIFVAMANKLYGKDFAFLDWMIFAFPFVVIMLGMLWFVLTRVVFKVHLIEIPMGHDIIHKELKSLGKMTYQERMISLVFVVVALLWITRSFLLDGLIPGINDTTIAIAGALVLFLVPDRKEGRILNWPEAERLPWGIIILFGGGLSIAAAFRSSGLDEWMGHQLELVGNLPLFLLILTIALIVNLTTEFTSNVATASIVLPILAALATIIGVDPYLLMITATISASCAFMLPVATAANAIVFSSGHLEISDMIKAGVLLNLISILLVSLMVYFVVPMVL